MFKWFRKKEIDDTVNYEDAEYFFVDELYKQEKEMTLKTCFLTYCELQRCANQAKDQYGVESEKTREAYDLANEQKRKVLNLIEELEKK